MTIKDSPIDPNLLNRPEWMPGKKWAEFLWDCVEGDNWVDDAIDIAKTAQIKLLEYLIADAKNINDHNLYPIIGKVQLESMLKQLEGKE